MQKLRLTFVSVGLRLAGAMVLLGGMTQAPARGPWAGPAMAGSVRAAPRMSSVSRPDAPTTPVLSVTLYGLTKDVAGRSSRYRLTNLSNSFPVNLSHAFYASGINPVGFLNDFLPAGATRYYDLAQIGFLSSGYSGHAVISADQPITGNVAPSLSLSGAPNALLGVTQVFTGDVQPITLTLPMTYAWSATGQSDVVLTGGLTGTVGFVWSALGTKTVTLTVTSAEGFDTRALNVIAETQLFLPSIQE